MNEAQTALHKPRSWVRPLHPRSPDEAHRVSTPLELFFDLVFVIAVAQAASGLHHGLTEAHVSQSIIRYGMVFFAIWWAWMNFTWFASGYDNDDVLYRLAVFVQLIGALILAAGVARAFDDGDYRIVTVGYTVMRLSLIGQWVRAARADPQRRPSALRHVLGITLCQLGWIGLLFVPAAWSAPGFAGLVLAEVLVPIWAERAAPTVWHAEHIAERYGLFTIIVLGESLLSASTALQSSLVEGTLNADVAAALGGGVLIVLALWWLYFDRPAHNLRGSAQMAFVWGYSHLFIFAAVAAVGAGLAVAVDRAVGHAAIGPFGAGAAVAIPVAIYLLGLWALHERPRARPTWAQPDLPITALLVLLTPATGQAALWTGLLLTALLVVTLARRYRTA